MVVSNKSMPLPEGFQIEYMWDEEGLLNTTACITCVLVSLLIACIGSILYAVIDSTGLLAQAR